MSQWNLSRAQLTREPLYGKLHNPGKFAELGALLSSYVKTAGNHPRFKRLRRKIIEETTNIVQHNPSWNLIRMRIECNASGTNFVIHIIYDGGEYRDPTNLPHVADTGNKFAEYDRTYKIEDDGEVRIRLQIKLYD